MTRGYQEIELAKPADELRLHWRTALAAGVIAFTHIVFGLLAAGAYRGLLPRRLVAR